GLPGSTIRAAGLNGRVRDGNGCGPRAVAAGQHFSASLCVDNRGGGRGAEPPCSRRARAVLAPCSRRASGTVLPARYCLHGGAARYCLHDAAVRCCGALWSLESSALVLLLWREGEGGSRWPSRCAAVSLLTAPLHAARRSGKAKPLG